MALLAFLLMSFSDLDRMWLTLGVTVFVNSFAYWQGPALVVAVHRASEIDQIAAADLLQQVRELSRVAGLAPPQIFFSDSPQPNAFSVSRGNNDSVIILTRSLLTIMSKEELSGIISHELAHIKSCDALTMAISTAVYSATISIVAPLFLIGFLVHRTKRVFIIGPALVVLIAVTTAYGFLRRSREYAADKWGAALCGHPEWLIAALEKLKKAEQSSTGWIASHNLAMTRAHASSNYLDAVVAIIVGPYPAIEHRIDRLKALSAKQRSSYYNSRVCVPVTRVHPELAAFDSAELENKSYKKK